MTVLPPPINLPYVLLFVLHHYAAALWRGFVAAFAALRCCRAGKRVSPLTDLPGSTLRRKIVCNDGVTGRVYTGFANTHTDPQQQKAYKTPAQTA